MKNITKVYQLEHTNQFILENEKEVIFQSYSSIVAVYNKEKDILTLGKDWNYSTTTSKHLYIWFKKVFSAYMRSKYNVIMHILYKKSNKRQYIQSLINKGIIEYNKELV